MSEVDQKRLTALLGGPEFVWLVERLRQRLRRGEDLNGVVALKGPSPGQTEAARRLLGQIGSGASLRVDLSRLQSLLLNSAIAPNLRAAVEALGGLVLDERQLRVDAEQSWQQLWREAEEWHHGSLWGDYLQEIRSSGHLKRLAGQDVQIGHRYLATMAKLNELLPLSGEPLAALSAALTGHSHALDLGQPLHSLALALLRRYAPQLEVRRDLWAAVGVLCDELSAPLLVLNLRAEAGGTTAQALAVHAAAGEPYRLSVRQLLRGDVPRFTAGCAGPMVYVCENPTVVAHAANLLGPRSAPLLCLEGQPKTAADLVLTKLRDCGVALVYHGDFDWAGISIANLMVRRYGAKPWRFDSAHYALLDHGHALKGESVLCSWDSELTQRMIERRLGFHEEQVLDQLLRDLDQKDRL